MADSLENPAKIPLSASAKKAGSLGSPLVRATAYSILIVDHVSNYQGKNEESDSQTDRYALQEQIEAAGFLLAEQVLRTAGDGAGETCALTALQQNDGDQTQGKHDQENFEKYVHAYTPLAPLRVPIQKQYSHFNILPVLLTTSIHYGQCWLPTHRRRQKKSAKCVVLAGIRRSSSAIASASAPTRPT